MSLHNIPMISFIQLPYRKSQELAQPREMRPLVVALVLGLILCAQIGLVLWVWIKLLFSQN